MEGDLFENKGKKLLLVRVISGTRDHINGALISGIESADYFICYDAFDNSIVGNYEIAIFSH